MGGKDTAGQQVHRVVSPGLFVVAGHFFIVKVLPEIGRINAPVFDGRQCRFNGVDIVDGKKTGDALLSGHGRDQAGHPVVAVNQIGLHPGDDIVDDFPLKGQGKLDILFPVIRINPVDIVKGPVFGQVNAVVRHFALDAVDFFF